MPDKKAVGADVLTRLRAPFEPAAVRFKIQSSFERDGDWSAMCVGYIDARLVVERLNLVVGLEWSDDYELWPGGLTALCRLTVQGVTRQDVGVVESGAAGGAKAVYSDALKRAGVKFGIGVSIYAMPRVWVKQPMLKLRYDGKLSGLKYEGERFLRNSYGAWLTEHAEKAFGTAISHGDVEEAQGDAEVDKDAPEPAETPPEPQEQEDPKPKRQRTRSTSSRSRAKKAEPSPPGGSADEVAGKSDVATTDASTDGQDSEQPAQGAAGESEGSTDAPASGGGHTADSPAPLPGQAPLEQPKPPKTAAEHAADSGSSWGEELLRKQIPTLSQEGRVRLKWYCGLLNVEYKYAVIAAKLGPADSAQDLLDKLDETFRDQFDAAAEG